MCCEPTTHIGSRVTRYQPAALLLLEDALEVAVDPAELPGIVALNEAHVDVEEVDTTRLELLDRARGLRAGQAIVIGKGGLVKNALGLGAEHVVDPELGRGGVR